MFEREREREREREAGRRVGAGERMLRVKTRNHAGKVPEQYFHNDYSHAQ